MAASTHDVLFLCAGNSVRSIVAESLLDHRGTGHFRGFSAGSFPKGAVRAEAMRVLSEAGMRTEGLRSKFWDKFAAPAAPVMDFVFTVCDQAAGRGLPDLARPPRHRPLGHPGPRCREWLGGGAHVRLP